MIGQFLIAFRESLEAAVAVAIVNAYLARTGRRAFLRSSWLGAILAVAASLSVGVIVWLTYGALSAQDKALFEGAASILAVAVLSSMIYWMASRGRGIRSGIERDTEKLVASDQGIGLTIFSFVLVFREGVETVLFLLPFIVSDALASLSGGLGGVLAGVIVAYGVFVAGMRLSLSKFFYFTSLLLVLLAGGLAGYGVHELIEYSEGMGVDLGWFAEYAYSLDIPPDSLFHHKGLIGSVFAALLGYTVRAEWGRVLVHLAYLLVAIPSVLAAYRNL